MRKRWSKLHFETIGEVISKNVWNQKVRQDLAKDFIKIFEKENEEFDRNRFRKSCSVPIEEIEEI